MNDARVVLHLDMNAFFASVEQRENPALRGKPVVVVGGLGRRGIVLTASYEARPYGIKTGMLLYQAQALCPTLVPVAGDFRKYVEASKKLFPVLERFTEKVEMTSCDEAFLDVTEARRPPDWDRARDTAARLQREVAEELSLPCSIGVAPNKLLAKLASEMKKPRGLTVIRPPEVEALLADLPVDALCGIGPRMKKNLAALGVRTCGQLGAMDFETLYPRFGVWGHWLKRMGRGEDDAPVARVDAVDTVKSVGHATTFPANTRDPEVLRAYVMYLSEKVAARLRRYGLAGREVALTVRDADFKTRTH
ncbi:MAG TPA: DNA polymerase IV, partial [Elusimicrobiota bacterium]|nr:DNA polymerase IV [Elusimicrobiota bacterium]